MELTTSYVTNDDDEAESTQGRRTHAARGGGRDCHERVTSIREVTKRDHDLAAPTVTSEDEWQKVEDPLTPSAGWAGVVGFFHPFW